MNEVFKHDVVDAARTLDAQHRGDAPRPGTAGDGAIVVPTLL